MSEPTLVILAAGLSTRYGSPKQIEPVGPDGEFIIDYSVYDAVRAGFKRVVFLIAPGMLEDFEAAIGRRVAGHVETAYAFQSLDRLLPPGYAVPEGRKRPWGTSHAVLCCREVVDGPFAMINADDFYGRGAFRLIYDALKATDTAARPMRFSMVGYELGKTVTPSGKVCRGVCRTSGGKLESIEERTYVVRTPEGPAYSLDGGETLIPLPEDCTVSMNFWGFTPDYFAYSQEFFKTFLSDPKNMENLKSEFFIPLMVDKLINDGTATVEVLDTTSKWFGVTYPEDRQSVVDKIQALVDAGEYPAKLF